MNKPNENFNVFDGRLILKIGKSSLPCNCKLYFEWFPAKSLVLETQFSIENLITENKFEVYNESIRIGECHMVKMISSSNNNVQLKAEFDGEVSFNDLNSDVNEIRFSVPNLKSIIGTATKDSSKRIRISKNRNEFECGSFIITIDHLYHHLSGRDELENTSGYLIQYSGNIVKKNKTNFKYKKACEILEIFGRFLSFINGSRTTPIFFKGYINDNLIWEEYKSRVIDNYTYSPSWMLYNGQVDIQNLWENFYKVYKSKVSNKLALDNAIHWYCESNKNGTFIEGKLIIVQTALELLYNWIVIEKNNLLEGKDAMSINAANKIRLLLSILKIEGAIPKNLNYLNEFVEKENIKDVPWILTKIRNSIVHSRENKRVEFDQIKPEVLTQTLRVSIWYIEMAILFSLNYEGCYKDSRGLRSFGNKYKVPWKQKNEF